MDGKTTRQKGKYKTENQQWGWGREMVNMCIIGRLGGIKHECLLLLLLFVFRCCCFCPAEWFGF